MTREPLYLDREDLDAPGRIKLEGTRKSALETGRSRLLVAGAVLSLAFAVVCVRLFDISVFDQGAEPRLSKTNRASASVAARANIVDRNGMILATSLPTASLYADPKGVLDINDAVRRIVSVLPNLSQKDLKRKLSSSSRFVWIKRNLTPRIQYQVNKLGIPGFHFQRGERRVYPQGDLAAHILGLTDIDGRGIAGVEKTFDRRLRAGGAPVRLSVDIRIQSILEEELYGAMTEFKAIGAAGVILEARTGEVVAMASLPDFDPNVPQSMTEDTAFNRVTKGVYEMGSTFKLLTAAAALDAGAVGLGGGYDATKPIRISRFTISDYHAKKRWLSVPEILVYSSNIGAAKMALDLGSSQFKSYLNKFGIFSPVRVELPEVGKPLVPKTWREINTMTVAFGHGVAISPLQMTSAVAALVNGGVRLQPTILRRAPGEKPSGNRVISEKTSANMRNLMRLVVQRGTGRNAKVQGYRVGGKTGTAEKLVNGRYKRNKRFASFVGAFPMDNPRYVLLIAVDEPQGIKRTHYYATGGWVAAPVVGKLVRRMAPIIGLEPSIENSAEPAGNGRVLAAFDATVRKSKTARKRLASQ